MIHSACAKRAELRTKLARMIQESGVRPTVLPGPTFSPRPARVEPSGCGKRKAEISVRDRKDLALLKIIEPHAGPRGVPHAVRRTGLHLSVVTRIAEKYKLDFAPRRQSDAEILREEW